MSDFIPISHLDDVIDDVNDADLFVVSHVDGISTNHQYNSHKLSAS
jgi:hypothetical protein